ncbi:PspA/IM30 family protein (plasmid) [Deinococcus sp. KNUC1210]|uniref:PspA/IM30 family protein n=1 Tax=Deinococcus sp. KNUC1210 TaxID=2917691 RepID=UPI001EEFF191|nr:PspA/IM30 family protein [Deinococcus sp. KNUC1210]ULH17359.1 PspA/IM30 family protein [Deinococcus sp. KNUC1210]
MKHQIALSMTLMQLAIGAGGTGTLPDTHLARINALQSAKNKPALTEEDLIVRPVRLFGNQLTSYFTRITDDDLRLLAQQINDAGGPALSAHMTDETPIGTFYAASVTPGGGDVLWLDTWVYFLNDADGQDLARKIDGGIINEASIGYWYERNVCSITGLDYWNSPYYAGREYEIVDPETGTTTTRLCFLWTIGNVEFAEGSLVYRGAYPGTQVGGDIGQPMNGESAVNVLPMPAQTRFQLAASRDMQTELDKKAQAHAASGSKPPSPAAKPAEPPSGQPPEGETVKLTLKLHDGSAATVENEESAQTVLNQQVAAAEKRAVQAERERVATAAGLEPAQLHDDTHLARLSAEAGDGRTYREDLLSRLERVTLTIEGNSEAGQRASERVKKVFKTADIADIRDEVERLEAKRDALVPSGQRSVENAEEGSEEPGKAPVRDLDSV